MSANPTLVTDDHFRYIAERTAGDDALLSDLKAAAAECGIPAIWISPAQGSLMQILLRLVRARDVVEVGTLAGYSAIWMARALPPDGRVRTIELHPGHAMFATEWIGRSDVADRVEVIHGSGSDVLPTFEDGSADAAFLDADKAGYSAYLAECTRILRPGGLLMVDNAFAFGQLFDEHPADGEAPAVKRFNEEMARCEAFHSVIVATGDGLWVGVKR